MFTPLLLLLFLAAGVDGRELEKLYRQSEYTPGATKLFCLLYKPFSTLTAVGWVTDP